MVHHFIKALGSACIFALLAGCAAFSPTQKMAEPGFTTLNMVSSLGGENNNVEIGVFSYEAEIKNNTKSEVQVKTVMPVLSSTHISRLLDQETGIPINQNILAGGTFKVSGKLRFDYKSLSKDDIQRLGDPITGFRVTADTFAPIR